MDALRLDTAVRCGIMVTGDSRQQVLDDARRVEALGFDSLWAGDHVAFHVPMMDSLTLLAFAAAATERVSLGTCVYLLPLRPPAITAKTAAALDRLSDGRLVLGVGVGGEFPPEFEACGVPRHERGTRSDETIPLLRRLWSERDVRHEGRHFRLGPVSLEPRPARPGGPPIWIGGRAPAAMRRAGRLADGYVSTMTRPERYRANLEAIGGHAAAAGRAPLELGTGALLFTALDADRDAALDRAARALGRLYKRPFRDAAARYCLLGRPEDCLEQMQHFAAAGCRHFILSPLGDPHGFVEEVARGILPELGALAAARPAA